MAEYRELPRIFTNVKKLQDKGLFPNHIKDRIPKIYTFGHGHIYFFYDKLSFLKDRYKTLVQELKARNFNISHDDLENMVEGIDPLWFRQNVGWSPNCHELSVSRGRIAEKIAMKPSWYRKTKYT